ncbi:MAG: class I SAM-dependent methyltransferase [Candidatus Hodarchaeota archaeon]
MIRCSKIIHSIVNRTPLKKLFTAHRIFVRAYFNYIYVRKDPYFTHRNDIQNKFHKAFEMVRGFKAKNTLEIGCGEGRFSHFLAGFSEKVLAIDISDIAIKRAKGINRNNPNIEFKRIDLLTDNSFEDRYDFIFCSEVLYYLNISQLMEVIPKIIGLLNQNGKLLLVHIRSLGDDISGKELKEFGARTIHEAFIRSQQLELEKDIISADYRITLLHRK